MFSLIGGLASMSSYHSEGSAACLGIDADPQTSFRTSGGDLAWWRVDLGVTRCVWNVNITCSNLTSNGEYQHLAFKMYIGIYLIISIKSSLRDERTVKRLSDIPQLSVRKFLCTNLNFDRHMWTVRGDW